MKILIVYSSRSGNTKKLADVVNQQLGEEKTFCSIGEAPEPDGYDLVVLGFWLQAGQPDPKSSKYLKKIGKNKLFLMATHGAAAASAHAANAMAQAKSLASEAELLGTFNCPGEVNPKTLEKLMVKDPPPPWIGDADGAAGHPDGDDIKLLTQVVRSRLADFIA
jgi:flavodoxin